MEKWEYITRFFTARATSAEIKAYIQQNHDKKPGKYAPEAMIPELNQLGDAGWEIIHMEPVAKVGRKEDVLFDTGWSHTYFCVMKRRKPGSFVPTHVMNQPQQTTQPPRPQAPPPPAVNPPADSAPPPVQPQSSAPPTMQQAQSNDLHPSHDQPATPPRSTLYPHG